jgi:chemotaxis protein methyltransferase CheR
MNQSDTLKFFADWIERELGIVYEDSNFFQLQDRLQKLVQTHQLNSIDDFRRRVEGGLTGELRQAFVDESTNNETLFFRDEKFFSSVERYVIADLAKVSPNRSINAWSVACSTGQEPYSLAILLFEAGLDSSRILATDIAQRVLVKAQSARYSDLEIRRGLPEKYLSQYFRRNDSAASPLAAAIDDRWVLEDRIRRMVEFKSLNLTTPFQLHQQFDLIFCRNVLIYQRVQSKKAILSRIASHLRPGGFFLMGSAESLLGLSTEFEQEVVDGVAVYRKKSGVSEAA